MQVTRLAPSPTGALHLGNARTFLINWLMARQNGWHILLRIEDLDGPRVKAGAEVQLIEDLRWLGIDWDSGPVRQSDRSTAYTAAINQLLESGCAYACVCSRKEVELAASAPHDDDGAAIYPGTCRGRFATTVEAEQFAGRGVSIRFAVPDAPVEFLDGFIGQTAFDPRRQLGDFVIRKSDGTAAYQLAVVVDDAESGVTQVIRGDDLIDSTPRQMMLYRALGMERRIPSYTHVPLVVGTDGRRLAKRHGDTRLAAYRAAGIRAERLLALLATWCGMPCGEEVTATELLDRFDLGRLPGNPIVYRPDDDEFLRGGRR
jgi:glutamyl-tRNA synthetase